jgi:beta-lactamase class D
MSAFPQNEKLGAPAKPMDKGWTSRIYFVLFVTLSISSNAFAGWEESLKVSKLFTSAEVTGTFVLFDAVCDTYIGHNKSRAEKRFVPASTFKIPNSLIGLSVGAVKSVDEVLPYKSNAPPFNKAWEKDMGIREAIVLSNVPIYQELARRIGLARMRENVSKINYGNKEIGDTVDTFWLNGPLEISAMEQAQFLAKLAQVELPLPKTCQESVHEILLLEQGENWKLYGKTGWQNAPRPGVGWWVGWVRKNDRIYSFALNMDIQQSSDARKRIEIGKAILKVLRIL